MSTTERPGVLLRRYRQAGGLTLGELARRVHYTIGYLSKVENGVKPLTRDLAARCDAVLGTGGRLVPRLAEERPAEPLAPLRDEWPGEPADEPGMPSVAEPAVVPLLRRMFEQTRELGHRYSPALVIPGLATQVRTLRALAGRCPEPGVRVELLLLAAHCAEYAGWMAQEDGDDRAALRWTRSAARLAGEAGDGSLPVYALLRQADITLYRADAGTTVELAGRVHDTRDAPPWLRALAAQRMAQGHALGGDLDGFRRALDRAAELAGRSAGGELGTRSLPDPAGIVEAWALFDLGRPAEAAALLDRTVPAILPDARRSRARYGIRRALAHAAAGEVERACALAAEVLPDVVAVDSATIRLDLRHLRDTLLRWRRVQCVVDLQPDLSAALHPRSPS